MSKLINVVRNKFSVIPNEVFWDRRLDFRTRGLLCTIFSLPDGWNFSIPGLVELVTIRDEDDNIIKALSGEGKDAIRVSLNKLEKFGYLRRIPAKDEKGKFTGYDYEINIPPIPMDADDRYCGNVIY